MSAAPEPMIPAIKIIPGKKTIQEVQANPARVIPETPVIQAQVVRIPVIPVQVVPVQVVPAQAVRVPENPAVRAREAQDLPAVQVLMPQKRAILTAMMPHRRRQILRHQKCFVPWHQPVLSG